MEPQIGWTLSDCDTFRRAMTLVRDDLESVWIVMEFLTVYDAYAERRLPGTSVLHKGLRYVLLVPWIYEQIARYFRRLYVADFLPVKTLDLTLWHPYPIRGLRSR